jgi:hypothetical protein
VPAKFFPIKIDSEAILIKLRLIQRQNISFLKQHFLGREGAAPAPIITENNIFVLAETQQE